ncbi:DinB family protein [Nonomuraea sp. LP-02]|nr:DinB family protein [Nonomuraea sp. LP-02]MED7929596.1 DinB family protein [Nonomuraea sp. LP-02]
MTTSDPKADLHHYLKSARDALLWKLDGLSEYDVRRPLTPTGTNLLGLVKHLAGIEYGYFGDTFGRPPAEQPPGFEEDAEPNADLWATPEESREEIVALYRRAWAHADATIEELPLDASAASPGGRRTATPSRCTASSSTSPPRPTGTPATPTSSGS